MRVITGKYRGRKLESPIGNMVRPTTDKVKEAIFNICQNEIYDAVCADIFAGSGALGIEALSRGAKKCYFGDVSRDSIKLIHRNVRMCGAENEAVIYSGDFRKVLGRIREKVDIFFLDPPYDDGLYLAALEMIGDLDLLAPQGIILAEHDAKDELPDRVGELVKVRVKKYGKTCVSIYETENVDE